ncbi:hypothetical protein ACVWZB_004816 [Paenibacillus polymyxa]
MELGLQKDGYIYGFLMRTGLDGGGIILDEGPKEHVIKKHVIIEVWNGLEYVPTLEEDLKKLEGLGGTRARIKTDCHSTSLSEFMGDPDYSNLTHEEAVRLVTPLVINHKPTKTYLQFEQSIRDVVMENSIQIKGLSPGETAHYLEKAIAGKQHDQWREKAKELVGESSWPLEDLLNQTDQMRNYGLSLRKAIAQSDGQQVLSLIKAIQKLAPMITKRADEVEEGMNNLY